MSRACWLCYGSRAVSIPIVTRFAPSPTGLLHLGHAYAALFAWDKARAGGGRFLLRIEDIDRTRCRPEFEAALLEDLAWLGLDWEAPVRRQSEHFDDYRAALDRLQGEGLLYPCFCTRAEIQAEIARAGAAPHGSDGPLYPGTCRGLAPAERQRRIEAGAPMRSASMLPGRRSVPGRSRGRMRSPVASTSIPPATAMSCWRARRRRRAITWR